MFSLNKLQIHQSGSSVHHPLGTQHSCFWLRFAICSACVCAQLLYASFLFTNEIKADNQCTLVWLFHPDALQQQSVKDSTSGSGVAFTNKSEIKIVILVLTLDVFPWHFNLKHFTWRREPTLSVHITCLSSSLRLCRIWMSVLKSSVGCTSLIVI